MDTLHDEFLRSQEHAAWADSISRFAAASSLAGCPPECCPRCTTWLMPLDVTMIQDNKRYHVDCDNSSWSRGFANAKRLFLERKALQDQHDNPFYQGHPV